MSSCRAFWPWVIHTELFIYLCSKISPPRWVSSCCRGDALVACALCAFLIRIKGWHWNIYDADETFWPLPHKLPLICHTLCFQKDAPELSLSLLLCSCRHTREFWCMFRCVFIMSISLNSLCWMLWCVVKLLLKLKTERRVLLFQHNKPFFGVTDFFFFFLCCEAVSHK